MALQRAYFRFYAGLNDFLEPRSRGRTLTHRFEVGGPAKDMLESFGVPHTEIELMVINGEPSSLSRMVINGDRVAVYPHFRSIDIRPLLPAAPDLYDRRFVLDVHLGRLASYLRMLGFDAVYENQFDDAKLAHLAGEQDCILLTRDVGLLKRSAVQRGYWLRETNPIRQLREVVDRYHLEDAIAPFTRCMHCNATLVPADKDAVRHRLPPQTAELFDEFQSCLRCQRVYWKGSHHERMQGLIDSLKPSPLL